MRDKPNNENSTVKQVLLDLKASGGDTEAIDLRREFLTFFQNKYVRCGFFFPTVAISGFTM